MKKINFIIGITAIALCAVFWLNRIYIETDITDKTNAVRLTDYKYIKCRHLLDGYNYAELDDGRADIIKPDGELLYNSGQYYVPYSMGYYGFETHDSGVPIRFPQNEAGDIFVVSATEQEGCEGLIRADGTMLAEPVYNRLDPMGINFFGFVKDGVCGVISNETGKILAETDGMRYLCEDKEKFLTLRTYSVNDEVCADINFYDKDGNVFDSVSGIWWETDNQYNDVNGFCIRDKNGNAYYKFENGNYGHYVGVLKNVVHPAERYTYDFVMASEDSEETTSPRMDKSYFFKEKKIGSRIYYAVFKNKY